MGSLPLSEPSRPSLWVGLQRLHRWTDHYGHCDWSWWSNDCLCHLSWASPVAKGLHAAYPSSVWRHGDMENVLGSLGRQPAFLSLNRTGVSQVVCLCLPPFQVAFFPPSPPPAIIWAPSCSGNSSETDLPLHLLFVRAKPWILEERHFIAVGS